jgi:hypothetical protein
MNARNIEMIIMPHFNSILDYYSKINRVVSTGMPGKSKLPLLDKMINKLDWSIDKAFLFSMDGSLIGMEEQLTGLLY